MSPYLLSRKPPWQLVLVFLILAISISSAGLLYYGSQKKLIKKERQDELLAIADLKESQIVNWRKERLADAATIFENSSLTPHIRGLLQGEKRKKEMSQIRTWMGSFRGTYLYDDILLADKDGNILLSVSQKSEDIGPDEKRLSSYAMKIKKVIFSDLYKSKVSRRILLSIVVPILDKEANETLGVFLLRIDPHVFLYPLIQTWPTRSRTAETILIRREGDEVVYLNDLRYRRDAALTFHMRARDLRIPTAVAAQGEAGIFEGLNYTGTEVFTALRSVPDSPWFIISNVDKEEVYAPIRARLWSVMIVIVLSILLAAAAVILILRRREKEEEKRYRKHLEETVRERTAELERVNKVLEASYRDMESFSYSASHDLRTPLLVISGFVQRMIRDYSDRLDPKGLEILNIVKDSSGRMEQLVSDLLAFSRVTTKEIQVAAIDMGVLVDKVFDDLRPTIKKRDVRLIRKPLPVGYGDVSMIRQVLVNLLSNAIKYTKPKEEGIIEVGGSVEAMKVYIMLKTTA
ncbi:MAG TPA: cache domain-containing protein [Thermodesulfovibrionales bacterium]|nr:cache domain-containing protein [Thermodesulfovibrionales bacterium]